MHDLLESRTQAFRAGHVFYRGVPHDCGNRIRYAKNGACRDCLRQAAKKQGRERSPETNREYMRNYVEKKSLYEADLMAHARLKSIGRDSEAPLDPWQMFDLAVGLWLASGAAVECYGRKATGIMLGFDRWVRANHPETHKRMLGGRTALMNALRKRGCVFASPYKGGGLLQVPAETPGVHDPWGGL